MKKYVCKILVSVFMLVAFAFSTHAQIANPKDANGYYIVKWDCANDTWAAANDFEVDETFTFAIDITGTDLEEWVKQTPITAGGTRGIAINRWTNFGDVTAESNRMKQIKGNIYGATWNIVQLGTTLDIEAATAEAAEMSVFGTIFGFEYTATLPGAEWFLSPVDLDPFAEEGQQPFFKTLPYTGTKTSSVFYNDDYPGLFDDDFKIAGYAPACASVDGSDMFSAFYSDNTLSTEITTLSIEADEDLILYPYFGNLGPDTTNNSAIVTITIAGQTDFNQTIPLTGAYELTAGNGLTLVESQTEPYTVTASELNTYGAFGTFTVTLSTTYAGTDPDASNDTATLTVTRATEPTIDYTLFYNSADGKFHKGSLTGDVVTEGFTGYYTGVGATLILNNFKFTTTAATALQFSGNTTINLVGSSSIASTFVETDNNSSSISYGIYTEHSLIIEGDLDATLTATGGAATLGGSIGVWVQGATATLAINSGTLEGIGGAAGNTVTAGGNSRGIGVSYGSLEVVGGHLIGRCGTAANTQGVSVLENGSLTMSSGSLTAAAVDALYFSIGLDVNGNMTVTGGTITATGGNAAEYDSYGLYVYGNLSVTGGTVEATCGTGGESQAGVYVTGTSTTTGMNITGGATASATDELTFNEGTYKNNGVTANYVKMEEDAAVSIADIESVNINIYPNPVSDVLYIESPVAIQHLVIYTMSGAIVLQESNVGNGIQVSALGKGVYIVKLTTERGEVIRKVVKQ